MILLPAHKIRFYAQSVGFAADQLVTAVAIALAESNGGDPLAYDPEAAAFARMGVTGPEKDGEGSFGLWQIFLWAHPEFKGWDLYDPQVNACAAACVFYRAGRSFRPWSTFTSGRYLKYLEQAKQ